MGELKIICPRCQRPAKRITKGVCHNCYRRYFWDPPKKACKRCGRVRPIQAWGFCNGCYNSVFHIEKVKAHNRKILYDISNDIYKEVNSQCAICGFDKIVELHHLDHNHLNNSKTNLVGLCPNHHKMVHHREFCREIFSNLKDKGFLLPTLYEQDQILKKDLVGTIHRKKLINQKYV